MKLPYPEKLKLAEWREFSKALKVKRGMKCEVCGTGKKLDVHHGYYKPDTLPWEYDENTLWVLCRECHFEKHRELAIIHRIIGLTHPKDYPLLERPIDDAVQRFQFGITKGEWEELLRDEEFAAGHNFSEYHLSVMASDDIGPSLANQMEELAAEEFPGIQIDIVHYDQSPDCVASVSGPEKFVCEDIEAWWGSMRETIGA